MADKRLFVVDDEAEFCRYVRHVATDLGYDVAETTCGDEFKRLYADFAPTAIVLDLIMPKVDGIELLRWLGDQNCRAKVIVVTGYDVSFSKMAKFIADEVGVPAIETFAKPVRPTELRKSLQ